MKSQTQSQSQTKKPRGRPPKKSIGPNDTQKENVNLGDKLVQYNIKHCSVQLNPVNIEQSAMDETSPAPANVPKRRGRKPKNSLAATTSPAAAAAKEVAETPTKINVPDEDTNKKNDRKKSDKKSENANDSNDANEASDANESFEKEKPTKLTLSEKKLARKAETEAIIASGGRGKRTPKPNPKYLDEPSAAVSGNKLPKDELDPAEHAAGEEGDDEMNQSSDERRNEGPLKKRMLQKVGIKSGPGHKPGSGKGTPGRKPGSGAAAGYKRKLEVDIDIDDDHGRKLFLDAKRRAIQNSPSGSDDDVQLKKSKSPVTDALAAKLRSKYPNDITVKRTITVENKISPVNRARLLEKSKVVIEKDGGIELRKRKLTEETETSEDDVGLGRGFSDQDASTQKNFNRRKTQHTKILSDDKVIRATPPPSSSSSSAPSSAQLVRKPIGIITKQINKSPLAQNQLAHIKSQGATKTYSILPQSRVIGSAGSNKPAILRQPPRILNSSLCKPTNKATVPSFVTKVVTKDDYEHELNKKRNNTIISSRSKENNVTSYVYTEKDGKIIPKKTVVQQISPQQKLLQQRKTVLPVVRTPATQQRIISEPVSMNIPNSKRIRKITCFETWYVIKMVDEHPKPEKSILSLSLMQIGNEIKKIELPSNEWTYKILLQPLTKQLLELRKTKANEKQADTSSKTTAAKIKNEVAKSENDKPADKKENADESAVSEDTKSSESESPKDEKKTGEDAGDDKKGDKTEDKKPETDSSETPKEESSTEKTSEDDKKDEKSKDEKKSDINAESQSQDSTENQSSDTSAKENDEKKSNEVKETKTKVEAETPEKSERKPSESSTSHDVYTGEVHDPNINPDERHNYRPINIMFRRKCQNPQIRIQFDRTVILKNQTFYLNVDGKNVRLVASPQSIETYDDIKTLLQIVDHINLSNCCVEPISQMS